jgi:hypothetical protein
MNKYEECIIKLRDPYNQGHWTIREEAAKLIEEMIANPPNPKHYVMKADHVVFGLEVKK